MPPARTAAPPRARARASSRPSARRPVGRGPRASALGAAALRVRWDRVGRIALLLVLVGVVGLYVGPARSYLKTWKVSNEKHAQLSSLERQHTALLQRAQALQQPQTVQTEARRLGMVRPGERPYSVQGLPGD